VTVTVAVAVPAVRVTVAVREVVAVLAVALTVSVEPLTEADVIHEASLLLVTVGVPEKLVVVTVNVLVSPAAANVALVGDTEIVGNELTQRTT
jgi:hypothetical protein